MCNDLVYLKIASESPPPSPQKTKTKQKQKKNNATTSNLHSGLILLRFAAPWPLFLIGPAPWPNTSRILRGHNCISVKFVEVQRIGFS